MEAQVPSQKINLSSAFELMVHQRLRLLESLYVDAEQTGNAHNELLSKLAQSAQDSKLKIEEIEVKTMKAQYKRANLEERTGHLKN